MIGACKTIRIAELFVKIFNDWCMSKCLMVGACKSIGIAKLFIKVFMIDVCPII